MTIQKDQWIITASDILLPTFGSIIPSSAGFLENLLSSIHQREQFHSAPQSGSIFQTALLGSNGDKARFSC